MFLKVSYGHCPADYGTGFGYSTTSYLGNVHSLRYLLLSLLYTVRLHKYGPMTNINSTRCRIAWYTRGEQIVVVNVLSNNNLGYNK
jgi:hypothetical protein